MKYCVSARQPLEVRKKADETFVEWKDRKKIYDLIEETPNNTIILELPRTDEDIDFNEIKEYKSNIILAISNFKKINLIKQFGFSFYWKFPITSYYEIRGLINLGVSYLLIGPPLYFDLKEVAKFNIPIRLVANLAHDNFIPREDGIKGTYVRPEDIPLYEEFVDTIEFYSEGLQQEKVLLKIYQEDQKWNGNLTKIIANLKYNVDNRGLPDEFGKIRLSCGQKCMRQGTCHFCEQAFIFCRTIDKAQEEKV